MKNFRIHFSAVELGSIGKSQKFFETIEAENADKAISLLYDRYEHIHVLTVDGLVYKNNA